MTQDHVFKYFEVRLISLAIMSIGAFFLSLFLFFLFISRGEYLYAVAMAVLMMITILAAIKLLQYAKTFREELRRRQRLRENEKNESPVSKHSETRKAVD